MPRRPSPAFMLAAAITLALPAAASPEAPPAERESPVRLGLHTGVSLPLAQEDAATGFLYGLSGRLRATDRLAASVSLEVVRHRDGGVSVGGERIDVTPPDVRSLLAGADVTLYARTSVELFATAAFGWTRLDPVRDDAETRVTTALGGGALMSLGRVPLWIEVSPRLVVVTTEEASRKHVALRAGVVYAVD